RVIVLICRIRLLTTAALASAIFCSGCSGRLAQGELVPVAQVDGEGISLVPVLVVTTRSRSTADAGEMFNRRPAEEVSYASVTVSIPPDILRRTGEVQWPASVPGDPRQSFVTVSANVLDRQSFVSDISAATKRNGRGKVLVFVHGFNNRFDRAVYRFAQITHDSRAPAVPVLFSWPSRGIAGLRAYQEDVGSANASRDAIEQLLDTIGKNPNVREVTVLCHSMGCSPTLLALHARAQRAGSIGSKVKNVMLVAPDVDADLFRTQMRDMGSTRPRFALFVSQDDVALKLSASIWGGTTRLGQLDPDQEPYKTDFRREGVLVFDLTGMRGRAHSRAFREVNSVMGMIEQRFAEGQQMTDTGSEPEAASQ
ncbi:MAG TPA: alpha/beta fold hydrolase, partial [Geobacterales bacterium]|nr:alpha/beta fold hydrolase [Geobacterales bacterium]